MTEMIRRMSFTFEGGLNRGSRPLPSSCYPKDTHPLVNGENGGRVVPYHEIDTPNPPVSNTHTLI